MTVLATRAEAPPSQDRGWQELVVTVLLVVAALGTSWSSYQATRWNGEQAANYSRANALRIEASKAALEGDTFAQLEAGIFRAWLDAKARQDEDLARFYQARFPATMKPAFSSMKTMISVQRK